jgi:hypothetical protein
MEISGETKVPQTGSRRSGILWPGELRDVGRFEFHHPIQKRTRLTSQMAQETSKTTKMI